MTDKKIKVLTISDHPMLPSGVGIQTRYIIEALLKTEKFEVVSLGGAIKHKDYNPINVEGYDGAWKVIPIDGYGNPEAIRAMLAEYKPDILYFMTDPRFYGWLWQMEHEIRPNVPMIYYHVWDNYPYPQYNKPYYDSNDMIVTISKVTSDLVQNVSPDVREKYLPHAVDTEIFKPAETPEEIAKAKEMKLAVPDIEDKMVFFWNNRNARRKQSGTLIYWFKTFLDRVGHDKAILIMHTDVRDSHGQPLDYLLEQTGMNKGQVIFSVNKLPPEDLSYFYKFADCTINISDAEGFGLATLESLSSATPIVVTMTGGLQEQVTDGEDWFGIGIEPSSRAIIGSLEVPYIYEDRISEEDFVSALEKMYNMSPEDREEMGKKGQEYVKKNYNFKDFESAWIQTMLDFHEECGSWENRKNYQSWELHTL